MIRKSVATDIVGIVSRQKLFENRLWPTYFGALLELMNVINIVWNITDLYFEV